MKVEVYPSSIKGVVSAPGSKSIAQRMAACALLAKGESKIHRYPESADCQAALQVIQNLGAIVTKKQDVLTIKGGFPHSFHAGIRNPKNTVFCGESGLSARMFTPVAALHNDWIEIQGEGSLLKRPFDEFEKLLPLLGAQCSATGGLLPLKVRGPITGGNVAMDGSLSSQFLTGLLVALPRASKDSEIDARDLTSIPYVVMTMEVMKMFGVEVAHKDHSQFSIRSGQSYQPRECTVPGDWSGTAFLLVAAAICADEGSVMVENLSSEITQADAAILEVLRHAGVSFTQSGKGVEVKASEIQAFDFDATESPDLIPPLVALAAFANGVSTIKGSDRLVHKESNRAKVLQEEFAKANIRISIRDNEMKIYPGALRPAVINSHNDHRIAMAATMLGLGGAKITIRGAEAVSKSFPEFFDVISQLGGKTNVSTQNA